MTTWVPTGAPYLWGHPFWECPSYSRAMHAAHPWNVTLTGRISSSGSLLVLRLNASSSPHAWAPCDLGFSLTDNWRMVRDPLLVAQLCCSNHRFSISHRPHYAPEDTSAHLGDRSLTTLRHLGSRALRDTGPRRSWDPACVAPSLLAINYTWGLVGTQAPQSRAVTCWAKRLSSRPWRPTWLCVIGREQCTEVTLLCAHSNLHTRVLINGQDLTSLALLSLR